MKMFKLLEGGRSPLTGYQWPLPARDGEPGEWTPPVSCVRVGANGYHLLASWEETFDEYGHDLWLAEGKGNYDQHRSRVAFEQARLVQRIDSFNTGTLRDYAIWCAKMALSELPIYLSKIEVLLEYCESGDYNKYHLEQLTNAIDNDWTSFRTWQASKRWNRFQYYATEAIYTLAKNLGHVPEMMREQPVTLLDKAICRRIRNNSIDAIVSARLANAHIDDSISAAMHCECERVEPVFASEFEKRLGVRRCSDSWEVIE